MKVPENAFCWIICLSLKKAIEGFNVVEFHDYCGQTITGDGGHILFNAQKLPDNQCNVTISGQMTSSFQYYIMFYFTIFNLTAGSCQDSNLLVTDDRYGLTSSGMLGLPEPLCGHNQTLAGTYFTASTEILRLNFRRKAGMENLTGEFSLKFIVFHKGTCDTAKEFKCPNQQCVAKQLHCGGQVNACGADEETSCKPAKVTEEYTIFETLSSFIPLVVIVTVGLPIKFKDKIRNFFGCPKNRAERASYLQANENHVEDGLHTSHGTVTHNDLNHSPLSSGTKKDYNTTRYSFVNDVNVDPCTTEHDRQSNRGHIEDVNGQTCPVAISHDVGNVHDVNRETVIPGLTPDDHDIEVKKESLIDDLHLNDVGRDSNRPSSNDYAEDDCFEPPLVRPPSLPFILTSSDVNLTVSPPGDDMLNNQN